MNDKKFKGGLQKIKDILAKLDDGDITPKEAKDLFEQGKSIIEECNSILTSYEGIQEELEASNSS